MYSVAFDIANMLYAWITTTAHCTYVRTYIAVRCVVVFVWIGKRNKNDCSNRKNEIQFMFEYRSWQFFWLRSFVNNKKNSFQNKNSRHRRYHKLEHLNLRKISRIFFLQIFIQTTATNLFVYTREKLLFEWEGVKYLVQRKNKLESFVFCFDPNFLSWNSTDWPTANFIRFLWMCVFAFMCWKQAKPKRSSSKGIKEHKKIVKRKIDKNEKLSNKSKQKTFWKKATKKNHFLLSEANEMCSMCVHVCEFRAELHPMAI